MKKIIANATYAAVILAAYEEVKTGEEKEWQRIRLLVDLVDNDVYGYFTAQFNDFKKQDKYYGVIDWYLPTADFDSNKYDEIKHKMDIDAVLSTIPQINSPLYQFNKNYLKNHPITDDEKHYYNSYNQLVNNYNSLLYYNDISSLPADLTGLLLPVTITQSKSDGIGMLSLSPYFPIVSPPFPAPSYNIADFARVEDIEKSLTGYKPYGMAALAQTETVKGKDISVASTSSLSAFLAAKKAKSTTSTTTSPQSNTIPPLSAPSPISSPSPSSPTPSETVDYALSIFGVADDNNIGGGNQC